MAYSALDRFMEANSKEAKGVKVYKMTVADAEEVPRRR